MLTEQEMAIIRERVEKASADSGWTYHEQEGNAYVWTNGLPGTRRVIVHTSTPGAPEPSLIQRWQGAMIANAPTDILALLDHISALESILRDMQTDSLVYKHGVKDGLRKALEIIHADCRSWNESPSPSISVDRWSAWFALKTTSAMVESKLKEV